MGSGGLALKSVYVHSFYFIVLTIFFSLMAGIIHWQTDANLNPDTGGYIGSVGGFNPNEELNTTLGIAPGDSVSGRGVFTTLYSLFFFNININTDVVTFMDYWWIFRIFLVYLPLLTLLLSIAALIWI